MQNSSTFCGQSNKLCLLIFFCKLIANYVAIQKYCQLKSFYHMNYTTLFKELAKIASKFNLIVLIFKIFLRGHAPDPPRRACVPTSNNIFHYQSFQWAPLKFFALLCPWLFILHYQQLVSRAAWLSRRLLMVPYHHE